MTQGQVDQVNKALAEAAEEDGWDEAWYVTAERARVRFERAQDDGVNYED